MKAFLRLLWVSFWVLVAVGLLRRPASELGMTALQLTAFRLFATMYALCNLRWYLLRGVKLIVVRDKERGE